MVLADRVRDAYSMNGSICYRVRKHHTFRFSFGIWLFPFHPHDRKWKPNGNLQFISWFDSLFVVIFSCYLFQCKADVITLSQHGFRFDASCLPFFFDSIPFPFPLNRRGFNRASILLLIPKNVSTDVSKLFFLLKLFSNSFIEASFHFLYLQMLVLISWCSKNAEKFPSNLAMWILWFFIQFFESLYHPRNRYLWYFRRFHSTHTQLTQVEYV